MCCRQIWINGILIQIFKRPDHLVGALDVGPYLYFQAGSGPEAALANAAAKDRGILVWSSAPG